MQLYTVTLEYIVTRQVEIISPDKMSHEEVSDEARRADVETHSNMPIRIRALREVLKESPCTVREVQAKEIIRPSS